MEEIIKVFEIAKDSHGIWEGSTKNADSSEVAGAVVGSGTALMVSALTVGLAPWAIPFVIGAGALAGRGSVQAGKSVPKMAGNLISGIVNFFKTSDDFYNDAVIAYEENRLQDAFSSIRQCLDRDEDHWSAYHLRGIIYFKGNSYSNALNDFKKVLSINSECHSAYYYRGVILISQSSFSSGINDLSNFINRDESESSAYFWRGKGYMSLKNYEAAYGDFTTAISKEPSNYLYYVARAELFYAQNKLDCVISDLTLACEFGYDFIIGNKAIAEVYLEMNDKLNSLDCCNKILNKNSRNFDVLLLRAKIYAHFEDYFEAIEDLSYIIAGAKNKLDALIFRSDLYLRIFKFEEAKQDFYEILKIDPSSGLAFMGLGMVAMERKKYPMCLKNLKRAKLMFLDKKDYENIQRCAELISITRSKVNEIPWWNRPLFLNYS